MSDNTIHLIGNAHLDPIWLWRWQEGCGEVLQTFRSALDRLNEYKEFVFTCSSASYYRWVEEIDPEMFSEIRARIKEGRWIPVNGWWVQPDCNMPSGESFARQALVSQLYYYDKFGMICRTGYNVDSFGHNGNLPQLLKKGGMTSYVMMRPSANENREAPRNLFWWESRDGSRVMTYRIPFGYGCSGIFGIGSELPKLQKLCEETGHGMMMFYGVGNHGGGPTKGDIEYLIDRAKTDMEELQFSSPDEYFEDMHGEFTDLPVWRDDLQHHASGCYSATSIMKQLNRKAENLLTSAEKWDTVAALSFGTRAGTRDFCEAWRDVCFNQFHDIMCGCSIMEAYEDVKESQGHAMTIASRAYNNASLVISRKIDTWLEGVSDTVKLETRHHTGCHMGFPRPVVVFNPTSYELELPVRTYHPSNRVTDSDGNDVPYQNVRSSRSNDSHLDTAFLAKVPPMGYATYWLSLFDVNADELPEPKQSFKMENEYISVEFDSETGYIKSLVNKETGVDYAAEKFLAIPTVIDDSETDTWAHNVFKFHKIKGVMELESIERVEDGALRSVIRVRHKFNGSYLSQDFILAKKQKTLRAECKALWQEQFTMLKMAFPLTGENEISTYEIPYSFIKRPCNGEEEPSQNWADLTLDTHGARAGLSVMTDSKYSYDCPGTELRLTLLRNVIFADHYSSRPKADFNFTDEGLNRFAYGIYLHSGEAEASDVVEQAHIFNNVTNIITVPESYHKGTLSQKDSFMSVNKSNVQISALKLCEDNSGALIIRVYETKGTPVSCILMSSLFDNGFRFDIGANEIKTFRVDENCKVTEVDFLEGIVR